MSKIFVIVNNGVAEVRQETVPEGFEVEVIDLDYIRRGESFPSPEAFNFCQDNDIFKERRKSNQVSQPRVGGRRESDLEVAV